MLLECILLQDFSSGNKCCQLAGSENFDFKFTFKFLFALSKEPGSCALLAVKIWLPRLHGFSLHRKIRPRPTVQSRWLKLPQPECRQTSPEIAISSRLIVSGSPCVFQTLLFSEDDLTAGALKYKPILWVESWPGHLCVQVHPRLHTGNLGRS